MNDAGRLRAIADALPSGLIKDGIFLANIANQLEKRETKSLEERDDSGPAFPSASASQPGMSLLDYFAAHAPPATQESVREFNVNDLSLLEGIALWNYEYAAKMLARRKAIALEEEEVVELEYVRPESIDMGYLGDTKDD